MTYEELLSLARRLEAQTLETVTGKRFTVGIYLDVIFFTPESTGYGQTDGRRAHERFLERYSMGAIVPLHDLTNPDTGLGFSVGYARS